MEREYFLHYEHRQHHNDLLREAEMERSVNMPRHAFTFHPLAALILTILFRRFIA
jgi:hypothetical protein